MMSRSLMKILIAAAASSLLFSCGEPKKDAVNPANMPVPVNLLKVTSEKALYFDKYPGTVVPLMQVDIRPVVGGYVTGIYFKEGEHVKKGQRLYSIDDSKFTASVSQAEAAVKVAESNLDQASKDADRYVYLNQHDAVAKQILDHAMTTLQNARNQLASARQDLAKAKTDLSYAIITAPFDGTIGISQVKTGTTVIAGQTILNTVSTDDPMAVEIVVNEKQIPHFLQLQQIVTAEADSIFTLALPDNSLYSKPGKISFIDRGVNPQTGAIAVRLSFANQSSVLRAGMSCMVRVKNNDTAKQLLVPSKAIVEQMGEFFVYIAKDTLIPPAGVAEKNAPAPVSALHALQKKVVMGQTIGDRVIIRSGLQGGEDLIVDGVQKLHDGSLITAGAPGGPQKAASK